MCGCWMSWDRDCWLNWRDMTDREVTLSRSISLPWETWLITLTINIKGWTIGIMGIVGIKISSRNTPNSPADWLRTSCMSILRNRKKKVGIYVCIKFLTLSIWLFILNLPFFSHWLFWLTFHDLPDQRGSEHEIVAFEGTQVWMTHQKWQGKKWRLMVLGMIVLKSFAFVWICPAKISSLPKFLHSSSNSSLIHSYGNWFHSILLRFPSLCATFSSIWNRIK